MNNPFCKSGELCLSYEGVVFTITFNCNEIAFKRKGVTKPLVLKREKDCWVCESHYNIPGRDRTIISFKRKHYFIYHFTYGFFNKILLQKLKNKLLRHTCDNSRCCNPFHLIPGTHKENMRDMVERERACRGSDHPHAVIDEDIARAILTSELPVKCLADIYDVSESAVQAVINRETWKHVKVEKVDNYCNEMFY